MALRDDAVYLPATGYIYTAETGTPAPAAAMLASIPDTDPDGWNNLGHTSREDLPSWSHDGGDPEVLGTWQNRALRSVVLESATEYVTFHAQQLTRENMQFYFGRGAGGDDPGVFHASGTDGQNTERAFLIVIVDGNRRAAFYAPRVSISREDDLELDSEGFMTFPMRATLLQQPNQPFFDWISPTLNNGNGSSSTPETEPAGT